MNFRSGREGARLINEPSRVRVLGLVRLEITLDSSRLGWIRLD